VRSEKERSDEEKVKVRLGFSMFWKSDRQPQPPFVRVCRSLKISRATNIDPLNPRFGYMGGLLACLEWAEVSIFEEMASQMRMQRRQVRCQSDPGRNAADPTLVSLGSCP